MSIKFLESGKIVDRSALMKFYYIVHRPDSSSPQATSKELPVKFMERSKAQTICDELNRCRDKNDAGFLVEEREEQKLRSLRQSF